jgi:hypothetical protein
MLDFVSVCKVRKINVKYVTCICAKRGDQNSAIGRVCFIRAYVFASAATFNTVFFFFLANQTSFKDEFLLTAFLIGDQFFDINLKWFNVLKMLVKITFLRLGLLHFKFHKNPLKNNRDIRLESLGWDILYKNVVPKLILHCIIALFALQATYMQNLDFASCWAFNKINVWKNEIVDKPSIFRVCVINN